MVLRLVFFIMMVAGLMGFATVTWLSIRRDNAPAVATAGPVGVSILVAARPLCPGAFIAANDITEALAPAKGAADAVADTAQARLDLVGATVRQCLSVGNAITKAAIVRPGERDFMPTVLAPGARAVSVIVEALAGTSGLAWAGDRVDLILTQTISDPTFPLGRRIAAETVARDVRVVAIEQPSARRAEPAGADNKARTITLEVTALQAERISVAARIGRLSVSIQSAKDPMAVLEPGSERTTWASDVSAALGADPVRAPRSMLRVFQGKADGKEYRF